MIKDKIILFEESKKVKLKKILMKKKVTKVYSGVRKNGKWQIIYE